MTKHAPDTPAYRVRAWIDGLTNTIDRDDVREVYVVAERASKALTDARGEIQNVRTELKAARGASPYQHIPDDAEFQDIIVAGSFDAERNAFMRLAATIGIREAYTKWIRLRREAFDGELQAEVDRLVGELRTANERAETAELDLCLLKRLCAQAGEVETEDEWATHVVAIDGSFDGDYVNQGSEHSARLAARIIGGDLDPAEYRVELCTQTVRTIATGWRRVDPDASCLCSHDLTPDGTLVRDGVLALGCPVHDPDAADTGKEGA